jgi:GT2 family glycosyltransferase
MVRVSVILANWNQGKSLLLTLASLAKQSHLPIEVVVADDGSTDDSLDLLDGLADGAYPFLVRYTTGHHLGYGLTVSENRAAKVATGDLLLFTNADLAHAPGSVAGHARVAGRRVAGGLIREVNLEVASVLSPDDVLDWSVFEAKSRGNLTALTNYEYMIRAPERNMYGVWGGNFSVSASDFRGVGGFNEGYAGLYGGEEADLIQRLRKSGVKVAWAEKSVAYHLAHPSKGYRGGAEGNRKYRMEYPV